MQEHQPFRPFSSEGGGHQWQPPHPAAHHDPAPTAFVPHQTTGFNPEGFFDTGSSTLGEPAVTEEGGLSGANQQGVDIPLHRTRFGYPEDDLPLLEELGIHPRRIMAKAISVLHPFRRMDPTIIEDTDLAGPLVFALFLGFFLSLQGKVQFGAIYCLSLLGILICKALLTLMSDVSAPFQLVTFQYWVVGSHRVMLPISLVVIAWSSWCATQMFVVALGMNQQKYLILYPMALFYTLFAVLTIF